jgi:hypothetical protein
MHDTQECSKEARWAIMNAIAGANRVQTAFVRFHFIFFLKKPESSKASTKKPKQNPHRLNDHTKEMP